MKQRLQLAALALGAALCFGATTALAAGSGGGGGGSMSAPSAPSIDPQAEYQRGVTALQAGNYREAVRAFRAVLRVAPNDTMTNYVYALALIGNDDARAARRPLERATRDETTAPGDAWVQLGRIYLQIDEPAKAQEQLDELNALIAACAAPECAETRRAELEAAKAQLEAAIAQGEAAAPTTGWLPPGIGEGRAAYADAVGLINQARYADALAALARAREVIGPHPDIYNYMGFANRKLEHFDRALAYYGQALLLDPRHVGANEYLGELYIEMGRFEDARRQLAVLDRLCPYGCAEREELARWLSAANE